MAAPKTVEEYLAGVPDDFRGALQTLRKRILSAAPGSVEMISYGIPTFKYKGRPLVSLGAAKKHCALYAINTEAHKDELRQYDASKGTIRFTPTKPLPAALVKKLVKERVQEIEERERKRKRGSAR